MLARTTSNITNLALTHRLQAARRPPLGGFLTAAGLLLVIPSAAGFVASLLSPRDLPSVDAVYPPRFKSVTMISLSNAKQRFATGSRLSLRAR
ncbi:hypothetical protein [Actinoplanes solisilvae]|uniref:hypothetical protein n=1 Tax=Actinoplanes solisilvae TaxID=2486853 RepID=UPI000FD782AF|nr:hypothetical protein [Actinoplanes solisilvae]